MKKAKSIIAFTLAFILCSCYMLNNIAAATKWTEFTSDEAELLFFEDNSNFSYGRVTMEYRGGGEDGYTDLMADTYAENIYFHGHTHVQNDIYYIAADVSIAVTYEDASTSSFYVRDYCEENYTCPCAHAVFEYLWPTPECYSIDTFTSCHEMYIIKTLNGWPDEYEIVTQYGPTLIISTSS